MGIVDSLKKATGVGLKPVEHYDRAYEKGVLLGPSKYGEAISLFENAAKRAAEAGDTELASRALANARLYGFVTTGSFDFLQPLMDALQGLSQIEQVGSRSEMVDAPNLVAELEGRVAEEELKRLSVSAHARRVEIHLRAGEAFKRIFTAKLVTYRHRSEDAHTDAAQARFFLHQGLAAYNQAAAAVLSDPDGAAEHMARAQNAFRQCHDERWAKEAQNWLANCRSRRTCWMCHRQVQGAGIHFRSFPAQLSPYVGGVVTALGQDASSIDLSESTLVLCTPCGSALERQADLFAERRADEVRRELGDRVSVLTQAVQSLLARIAYLESVSHRH